MFRRMGWGLILVIALSACQRSDKSNGNYLQNWDAASVKQMITDYVQTTNKNDPKGMINFWAEDSDLVNAWGQLAVNREDIAKTFKENRTGKLKNAQIKESIEYVRFITPDVVLVDIDRETSGMVDDQGMPVEPFVTHGIYVLVKKQGEWKIAAFRSYFIQQMKNL